MLLFFHLSVVSLNIFALWYDQTYVELPFPSEELAAMAFKGRGLFLTIWCLLLQTIYFAVTALNDVIGSNTAASKKPPLIRIIKDTLFSLAFTVALYVSSTFWSLYFIDKNLIFPDHVERQFPKWMNHTMHTFIVPFLIAELLFTKRNYPSRRRGITVTLIFNIAYVVWSHIIYFKTGQWTYPFLNVFSTPLRILFFGCSSVVAITFYLIGEKLNNIVTPKTKLQYTNGNMKKN